MYIVSPSTIVAKQSIFSLNIAISASLPISKLPFLSSTFIDFAGFKDAKFIASYIFKFVFSLKLYTALFKVSTLPAKLPLAILA